ncbi:MAG: response regulator [Candidatus Omnitrophica bacterium]|nr:response regulator [Candidatus Omnitrophota bacterium]
MPTVQTKKILLVEDEPDILELFAVRLEINGFEVVQASDGSEAMESVKKMDPDLIVLDLMLPKIDGYELCRMLRFEDKTTDVPIIILSALTQDYNKEKAFEVGATEYLTKPLDLSLLVEKINEYI